jgi:hypothetical protein
MLRTCFSRAARGRGGQGRVDRIFGSRKRTKGASATVNTERDFLFICLDYLRCTRGLQQTKVKKRLLGTVGSHSLGVPRGTFQANLSRLKQNDSPDYLFIGISASQLTMSR